MKPVTRPADRHPEAARQVLRDRDASPKATHNAMATLGISDDAFTQAVRRASVRPQPRTSWGVIPATLAGVIAWCAIVGALTVGAETWWTARNAAAVEAGE